MDKKQDGLQTSASEARTLAISKYLLKVAAIYTLQIQFTNIQTTINRL